MTCSAKELLRRAWLEGRAGTLAASSEARAWALREAWRDNGKPAYGMHTFIAERLTKVGGGRPTGEAVAKLLAKFDADPEWFPGKSYQERHGPTSVITGTNQSIAARSAMAMKQRGQEPTYANMVAANPKALLNDKTGNTVGKKRL